MNMLSTNVTTKCLIAECWIPTDDVHRVREALKKGNVIILQNLSFKKNCNLFLKI